MELQLIEVILKILQNGNPKYRHKDLVKFASDYCNPTKQQTSEEAAKGAIKKIIGMSDPKILNKRIDKKTDKTAYQVYESFEAFKFLSTIFTSDKTLEKIKDGRDFFYTKYAQRCTMRHITKIYEYIKEKRKLDVYEPPESIVLMQLLTISPSALFYAMSDEDLDIDYTIFLRKVIAKLASDSTENRIILPKDIIGFQYGSFTSIQLKGLNMTIPATFVGKIPKTDIPKNLKKHKLPVYEVGLMFDGVINYNGKKINTKSGSITRWVGDNSDDVIQRFNEDFIVEYEQKMRHLGLEKKDCPIKITERPEEWYESFLDWYKEQSN